ncbi:WYL domain-containing protein [Methyloligella sp. 2.7D]|uniref:WYL domain-containing protein n=1 Tax=unclassified Methyloligella TaxID=2625955 RepID=UPI00157E0874|nr:WYL domain-containing protein [Methyloligella sp. GL2]QKP76347.1 hypothetical protein HT051_02065 [Methyloligella sp. GL2]
MLQSLLSVFGERKATPPTGFRIGGASFDTADMEVEPSSDEVGRLVGVRLALTYEDSKGDRTRRLIVVEKVSRTAAGEYCLQAFCELRQARRSFRVDRIVEIIDTRTGEVHEEPEAFLSDLLLVAKMQRTKKRTPSEDPTSVLLRESTEGLTVLLYFGHADQHLKRQERRILWSYLDWQQDRCSIRGRVPRRSVNSWMDAMLPDTYQFSDALEKVLNSERVHRNHVLSRIPEIVLADGVVDSEERNRLQSLLELLEQQF